LEEAIPLTLSTDFVAAITGGGTDRECPGGDRHFAQVRGSRSTIEVRNGVVSILPRRSSEVQEIGTILKEFVAGWARGASVEEMPGPAFRVQFPATLHVGHEEHFAQVAQRFLADLHNPATVPAWEDSYTLARYHITTRGLALAHGTT
jgi:hypothetical protein